MTEGGTSDAALVHQALAGQRSAYEALARRWSARVLAVCHARVGCRDIAEDLAQETLLRALRSLKSLSDPTRFGPWICGIASHACLDWLKRRQREAAFLVEDETEAARASADCDGTDPVELRDELARLMQAVERLPDDYREALMHYYYDDCTYDQLAALLGVSAATINARLTKARQMLRQRLGANGAERSRAKLP